MKLSKQLIAENIQAISTTIDNVVEAHKLLEKCNKKRYKKLKEELIKSVIRLKYMMTESLHNALKMELNDKLILESARQNELLAEKVLSNDSKERLIATLESMFFGHDKKLLESYLSKEDDDLGIQLQKTIVNAKLESFVTLVEACKKKKKKKSK